MPDLNAAQQGRLYWAMYRAVERVASPEADDLTRAFCRPVPPTILFAALCLALEIDVPAMLADAQRDCLVA